MTGVVKLHDSFELWRVFLHFLSSRPSIQDFAMKFFLQILPGFMDPLLSLTSQNEVLNF